MISCVACILMHDQTTQGTLFTLSSAHDFVRSVHLDARPNHIRNVIQPFSGIHDFVRSVHLDARPNHTRNVIQPFSSIHDFVRSVHLDARPNHVRNVIQPFSAFMISCNKLHATILLFSGHLMAHASQHVTITL